MKKPSLLTSMLAVLVDEWGVDRVYAALSDLEDAKSTRNRVISGGAKRSRSTGAFSGIIEDLHVEQRMHELLRRAASSYAARQFLPSVGDVRHFLSVHGAEEVNFKDRTSAARYVLGALSKLDIASAQAALNNPSFAGPSKLAPLSSAIRTAGSQLRPEPDEIGDSSLDEVPSTEHNRPKAP